MLLKVIFKTEKAKKSDKAISDITFFFCSFLSHSNRTYNNHANTLRYDEGMRKYRPVLYCSSPISYVIKVKITSKISDKDKQQKLQGI